MSFAKMTSNPAFSNPSRTSPITAKNSAAARRFKRPLPLMCSLDYSVSTVFEIRIDLAFPYPDNSPAGLLQLLVHPLVPLDIPCDLGYPVFPFGFGELALQRCKAARSPLATMPEIAIHK